nr:2-phospho-L-lactate guanylyltransferase [Angustibacter aerolatus]
MPWVVVLPVKHADRGKTRLDVADPADRVRLARAVALDSLAAVRACPDVAVRLVVTGDPQVSQVARAAGDEVLDDPARGWTPRSTPAWRRPRAGGRSSTWRCCSPTCPRCARPSLSEALQVAAGHDRALVADHEGSGTVLLTASAGVAAHPAFGPGSAAAHQALGAVPLTAQVPSLRQDVDTVADLRRAAEPGAGTADRTRRCGRRSGVACPRAGHRPRVRRRRQRQRAARRRPAGAVHRGGVRAQHVAAAARRPAGLDRARRRDRTGGAAVADRRGLSPGHPRS